MRKFPDCYPENFESEILPKAAREQEIDVYRVAKTGKIEESTFWSTYIEELNQNGGVGRRIIRDLNDPSEYSTSCFEKYKTAAGICKMLTKNYPPAIVIKGKTEPVCGPSQRTAERTGSKKDRKSKHVDWWLYDKAFPKSFVIATEKDG